MSFTFKDQAHRDKITELSAAADSGDGCAIASRLKDDSADQKWQTLQDLHQYRESQAADGKLPKLEIIVSSDMRGYGGVTLSRREGVMLSLDWDPQGHIKARSCVDGSGKAYYGVPPRS